MLQTSLLLSLLVGLLGMVGATLVDWCHNAGCLGDLTCEPPTILTPNATLKGCCPGCVKYILGVNSSCSSSLPPCQPGLSCSDEDDGVCRPDNKVNRKCQSYPFRAFLWRPKCDQDGSFSAKQCKGERLTGRCFCYSKEGKRIFGQQWQSRAENMTCACSRRVEELRLLRNDVTLHCSEEGNYEALQCDDGVCWCADEKLGDAQGEVVPETLVTFLPCYNKTLVGDSYLKKCDSANSALYKIRDEMKRHGMLYVNLKEKNCGLDGSYGSFQFENGINYCTWRDNSKIGSFMSETSSKDLNCNCARDTKYFALEGSTFTLACSGNGNYITLQKLNDEPVCVDSDGFKYVESSGALNDECKPLP